MPVDVWEVLFKFVQLLNFITLLAHVLAVITSIVFVITVLCFLPNNYFRYLNSLLIPFFFQLRACQNQIAYFCITDRSVNKLIVMYPYKHAKKIS